MNKNINNMTTTEFRELRGRKSFTEDIGTFDCLVLLPTRRAHDSGYRCIDFVAVKNNTPICRLSGCSDVLHIDGIGGYGEWTGKLPSKVLPKGWSIDCLKKSGLFRVFLGCTHKLKCGATLSSFDIYGVEER